MSESQPGCGQWLPPQCETCGVELTSGFMAAWCPRAKACQFWVHDPASEELLLLLEDGPDGEKS